MGRDPVAAFRDAETAFLETGDEQHLDRLDALLAGELAGGFAPTTRVWLLVLRHDCSGEDATLDAATDAFELLSADSAGPSPAVPCSCGAGGATATPPTSTAPSNSAADRR